MKDKTISLNKITNISQMKQLVKNKQKNLEFHFQLNLIKISNILPKMKRQTIIKKKL
jgi:hypothetical protein